MKFYIKDEGLLIGAIFCSLFAGILNILFSFMGVDGVTVTGFVTTNTYRFLVIVLALLPLILLFITWLINIGTKKKDSQKIIMNDSNGEIISKYKDIIDLKYKYKIRTSYINPLDNKLYYFESKELFFDPSEYISDNNLFNIKIKYQNNFEKYEMDISVIEEYFKKLQTEEDGEE